MANTEARRGLINPRLKTGGTPFTETRPVESGYKTILYPGQLIRVLADGTVELGQADASATTLGICQSFLPAPSTAATGQVNEVQVVTDLGNTIWEVQLSTSVTGQTIVGMNVSMQAMGTVNTTSNQSRMYGGTPVTTAQPWRIIGFPGDTANEKGNANMRVLLQHIAFNDTSAAFSAYDSYSEAPGI